MKDQEKDNSINDTTLNPITKEGEGEILDCNKETKTEEDREYSSETVKVSHQPTEKLEMETHGIQEESNDVSYATSIGKGGEKIGDDLNNHEGSSKSSLSEKTGDKKTDPKDNTCKKEEGLVVDGTQEESKDVSHVTSAEDGGELNNHEGITKSSLSITSAEDGGEKIGDDLNTHEGIPKSSLSVTSVTSAEDGGEKIGEDLNNHDGITKSSLSVTSAENGGEKIGDDLNNHEGIPKSSLSITSVTSAEDGGEKIGHDLNNPEGITKSSLSVTSAEDSGEKIGDNLDNHEGVPKSSLSVTSAEDGGEKIGDDLNNHEGITRSSLSVTSAEVSGEKIGDDLNNHEGITKSSLSVTSAEDGGEKINDDLNNHEGVTKSSLFVTSAEESGENIGNLNNHEVITKSSLSVTSIEDGGEKIGDDLNNNEGITKSSLSEKTEDKKTDPKDNSCSKKEEGLVVGGTSKPIMEANNVSLPEKASVLTKFVKLKSLYGVSNVLQRLSRKTDVQNDNDSDEKNKNTKEVKTDEKESQETTTLKKDEDEDEKKEASLSLESQEPIAMKGRVVLYTRLWCQDCKEARLFLRKRRLRYSEINVDVYPGRKLELEKMIGSSDVPRVFFNEVPIGGLKELKGLDESGKLQEKIEYVTSQGPSPKGPLPPFSGEDDVSSRGIVDELAVIVRKMKETIVVKDRFYKFRRVTNCFLGSEAVDFLSEDQLLEREEAIEFARKLAKELFFRHVLEENTFEDGNHLYRFLDQDPVISQCQNIPRGIIQSKRQPLVELSHRLRFILYAILEAYISEDGRHVAYRTIHGSEEFARFLRIVEELQRVDLNRMGKEESLAFFINLYNLMAIHAILVWGHPEGALDRRKLFNEFKYVIGGCAYSLSDIYNGILRGNQRPPYTLIKPFGINDRRFKVSLAYPEPLVHFALVSGNRSAPALRCYSPENIDVELVKAAHDFLQSGAFALHLDSKTISVTKILKWYSVDFGKNALEVLKHAANYLEVEKTRTLLELLNSSQFKVVYQPYDWRLNS